MKYPGQRGAVAPFVAILLFVIVICVSIVIDLGHIHSVKGQLQRAVDAAALAGARYLPNENKVTAVSTATAGENTVDNQPLATLLAEEPESTTLSVAIGSWDRDALGSAAVDRWVTGGTPPSAVKVRAKRDVDHIFFFFLDSSEVVADAIALSEPINPISPLTVVSCIPLSTMQEDPGKIPGTDECDIGYYRFNVNGIDSAAWTGLTFGHSANEIRAILSQEEQRQLFEQIVFGTNADPSLDANSGIENTGKRTSNDTDVTACAPDSTLSPDLYFGIDCGLGAITGYEDGLAPPTAFQSTVPAVAGNPGTDIPIDPTGGFWTPEADFDPLYDYPSLPRWYHINDSATLQEDDHFTRLWTLDGLLLVGPNEQDADISAFPNAGSVDIATYSDKTKAFGAYQARIKAYFDNPNDSSIVPAPFADGRMSDIIGRDLPNDFKNALFEEAGVSTQGNAAETAFLENYGLDELYFPNFQEVVRRAGYPLVGVNNGSAATLMSEFLDNPGVVADEANNILQCSENEPLNGITLKAQVPVIFTGYCEQWQALSNPSGNWNLYYIGLADLLITRLWKNPDDFDCGGTYVHLDAGSGSCTISDFDPALAGGGNFSAVNSTTMATEGLFKVPEVDASEASSLIRVFLVE